MTPRDATAPILPATPVLRVALPVPLRRLFDYLPPTGMPDEALATLQPGVRVLVPFGKQRLLGVLIEVSPRSDVPPSRLKLARTIVDDTPALPPALFQLANWAASYYQYPIGEVMAAVLPQALRDPLNIRAIDQCLQREQHWQAASHVNPAVRLGPRQQQLLDWLGDYGPATRMQLGEAGFNSPLIRALADKQLIQPCQAPPSTWAGQPLLAEPALPLNDEQAVAVAAIRNGQFATYLLEGVTGSGKTEVYLQLIARSLQRGEQALVLVPEIGLTPQTVARFRRRFRCPIAVLHSALSDGERFRAWQQARAGEVGIVIGTRSALFTPLAKPGLIIVDEEHDSSFKQQDGFRYSARDLAVLRGQREAIPVVLGSATPALETLHNAMHERYQHLRLTRRAGGATAPQVEIMDTRGKPLTEGLARETLQQMRDELARGNQVMVFLNRRGYAPALVCADCRWLASCPHCAARLTVHRRNHTLCCHHCDYREPLPAHCPQCRSTRLDCVGIGTQRSEQFLAEQFGEFPVIRVDRDSTSRKHALETLLQPVIAGQPCLLIGTQMLAKGHHFPHVTLVVMLDIDSGLFSADFRAAEKMGQLLEQVAGRAGRAEKPGRVLVQSQYSEHPLLQTLLREGYSRLARMLLAERRTALLPPYAYLALLRCEHADPAVAQQQLQQWREQLTAFCEHESCSQQIYIAGPLPALMEKRAGLFRFDLQIRSTHRLLLQRILTLLSHQIDRPGSRLPAELRWSLDVDPC